MISMRPRLALALTLLSVVTAPALLRAEDDSDADLRAFVAGDYAVVGRGPDSGAAYAGSARISHDGKQLILERRIAGRTLRATGHVEKPSPGEGRVLRFRWAESKPITMTCLASGDLDNYARLTCLWGADAPSPKRPGLEAMFHTATWP